MSTIVEVPEPDWSAERSSDTGSEGQVDVTCPNCEAYFAGECDNSATSCEIVLDEYPETTVEAELAVYSPPADEEWVDYSVPDDPHGIFIDSYHHTIDLLTEHGGDGAHLVNRMIFAHQVGSLEAYLGDTLINATIDDSDAIVRLLTTDPDLTKEKFSLAQIASDPEFVKTKARAYLKSIIYHNLSKVRALYVNILKIDLYVLLGEESKEKLFKGIEYRHDCVHRNGHDKSGNRLEVFTKAYVQEIAAIMKSLVEKIEQEVHKPVPAAAGDDFAF